MISSFFQRKITLVFCNLMALGVLQNYSSAYASLIQPAARAQRLFSGANLGSSMSSTNAWSDLCTKWTSDTNNGPSINKEMWNFFRLNAPGQVNLWIEAGAKDGAVGQSVDNQTTQVYRPGHFIGFNLPDTSGITTFKNFGYGSFYPSSTHTYEIKQIAVDTVQGYATWAIFLDGTKVYTIPRQIKYTSSVGAIVGIENKDNTNSFKSGTYFSNWRYLSTTGTSTLISTASNFDVNLSYGLGYLSTFTYSGTTNKVSASTTKACPSKTIFSQLPSSIKSTAPGASKTHLEPTYKANDSLPPSSLISKAKVVGHLSNGARLVSANMRTWGAYEDVEEPGAGFLDISRKRMVWVVKTYHARLETDDAVWTGAMMTTVIDAETGREVTQSITGKMIKDFRFQGLPTLLEAPKFNSQ